MQKLIFEIPDYAPDVIKNSSVACDQLLKAVKNGTPYGVNITGSIIDGEVVPEDTSEVD